MKIVFLVASLEPGRCGIGDYTRRLAGELIRQGHLVQAISINEQHLSKQVAGDQYSEGVSFEVLRLPSAWSARDRYIRITSWINNFQPDWVSLQFVNFGFHNYGLPWHIITKLGPAISNVKFHIMFHELWCGMGSKAKSKEKVLGVIQKLFIQLMLAILKPTIVYTSIRFYADQLSKLGIKASLVPIFGNIPLKAWADDKDWERFIISSGLSDLYKTENTWLVLGFFGAIYSCPGLQQLLNSAADAASQLGRNLGILIIGNSRGQDIRNMVKNIPGSACWETGILPPDIINRSMRLVDMGVVTTSAIGLRKSGTASAWLERGIPVLISSKDNTYHKDEMMSQGAYQVVGAADILCAFKGKGKIFSKNRFDEVTTAYSSLSNINADKILL